MLTDPKLIIFDTAGIAWNLLKTAIIFCCFSLQLIHQLMIVQIKGNKTH
jgi:hypothetical protein